ncbi:acyltransferase family protein [Geodermatophilus ruber]|uniref:Peptidoglycan/LPS O-acetylase OafA/YrhL, contains acyltransferase and SGNH-hydrolase domains n=1 Tax=Geodermatophilus ruber TaxID=504800 RepID=A0A1I4LPZ2_9ACTN|nr:acyltransferase [Geodermatophilus ruber]SFL92906.1 Peptidoglycan/LPS O-acetylase OafA/YrhL, contains acyltransferase and SGNH-hydrolase domains [Geodermatophilus ruber]
MNAAGRGHRLASLDGLRGLAALVVVVHHCALTLPSLAAQFLGPNSTSPAWWLTYTPAYLAWAGREAVLVFFVLSGLVLALPRLSGGRSGGWSRYYRKRMVRLYVPVLAAVAFTGIVLALVPRTPGAGWSWWMLAHTAPLGPVDLAHDAVLVAGTGWANSALWSLKYEVLFSLLLPVFVLVARRVVLPLWVSVPVVLAGIGWAASAGYELVSYLAVFGVGVLLAQQLGTLSRWAAWIDGLRTRGVAWAGLLILALTMLLGEVWARLATPDPFHWWLLGRPAAVLGAGLLVVCCLHAPGPRRLLSARPLQWLGTVSFALYLVHEPIVVSVATVTGPTKVGVLVTLVAGTALSLGAAVLFHRAVERPSMRLADRLGRSTRPAAPAPVPPRPAATDTVLLGLRTRPAVPPTRVPARAGRSA